MKHLKYIKVQAKIETSKHTISKLQRKLKLRKMAQNVCRTNKFGYCYFGDTLEVLRKNCIKDSCNVFIVKTDIPEHVNL